MILGASLLTARGVPAAGEYELRTSLAMLIMDRLGAGGSFTELQALDFTARRTSRWATTAPRTWRSARGRPLLRGLGRLPRQARLGRLGRVRRRSTARSPRSASGSAATAAFAFVAVRGRGRRRAALQIGNTTSRVDFGCDPGEWTDAWSATGISHHWALGTGHRVADLAPSPTSSALRVHRGPRSP